MSPGKLQRAISAVRRALEFERSRPAYLAISKIYRLVGNRDSARNHLNRATQINGDNGEAWAQLGLLNAQKDSGSTIRFQLDMGQGIGVILTFALLVIGAMYAGANVLLRRYRVADGRRRCSGHLKLYVGRRGSTHPEGAGASPWQSGLFDP